MKIDNTKFEVSKTVDMYKGLRDTVYANMNRTVVIRFVKSTNLPIPPYKPLYIVVLFKDQYNKSNEVYAIKQTGIDPELSESATEINKMLKLIKLGGLYTGKIIENIVGIVLSSDEYK